MVELEKIVLPILVALSTIRSQLLRFCRNIFSIFSDSAKAKDPRLTMRHSYPPSEAYPVFLYHEVEGGGTIVVVIIIINIIVINHILADPFTMVPHLKFRKKRRPSCMQDVNLS